MLNLFHKHLGLTPSSFFSLLAGTGLMAFAMVNIHLQARITEGGMLGFSLLISHFTGISPAYLGPVCDGAVYLLAFSLLGRQFIKKALFSTLLYAAMFKLFSACGPVLPSTAEMPWLAAIIGGLAVGLGVSFVVLPGFATGGDDTLVLLLHGKARIPMGFTYMFLDCVVLLLSLSYLPFNNIVWSFLTTLISSSVVGRLETSALVKFFKRKAPARKVVIQAAGTQQRLPQNSTLEFAK